MECVKNGYVICVGGVSQGVFRQLPDKYTTLELRDYGDKLILPGLVDLHVHAPQHPFRTFGMDLELIDWLNTHTFTEEAKYKDLDYAAKAYRIFVEEELKGPNTRICAFATIHADATLLLMDIMEKSGLVSFIGKVNMDRNSPPSLQETDAVASARDTVHWIEESARRYKNTKPILTPRFIPSCSDELMTKLHGIQKQYDLPVQSHLSENMGEVEWVKQLCPDSKFYGDAYDKYGMFGNGASTIMAHCVWVEDEETELLTKNRVFVAHCPESNINLSSGIAPIRQFLRKGVPVGLGSDIAAGTKTPIFDAMASAIRVSKLYWRLVDSNSRPLSVEEAFYLGTVGGGAFFGKVGSFEKDFEFDAIVLDDSSIARARELTLLERVTQMIYLFEQNHIFAKYARGRKLYSKIA
ncbi:MAG: amidohydrolase family protein [Synergistaceae bacterium]|jgi:guanine deaminase|nr:amidohydrolase family protein [Synergistaceae bacterium]